MKNTATQPTTPTCPTMGARPLAMQACAQVIFAIGLAVAGASASAQAVMVYEQGQLPKAEDVANILSRGASEAIKLRGQATVGGRSPFDLLEPKPTRNVSEASAVSVPVPFDFNSATLNPKARKQLDVIAEGIRLTDGTVRVVIEGHTDAKGRPQYNDNLSLRRAASVRSYLVSVKNLPVSLLSVEGKGAHKLLDKDNPYNAANRRVQFRAG